MKRLIATADERRSDRARFDAERSDDVLRGIVGNGSMTRGIIVLAALGSGIAVALIIHFGVAGVTAALVVAGWSGLASITLYHLVPLAFCAAAWRAQLRRPPASMLRYIWFRLARDAGGALLPAGGELLSIRVMALDGIDFALAAASTVVDLTAEMGSQVAFALLGLVVLVVERPADRRVYWALAGLALIIPLVAALALAQRLGLFRRLERLAQRLAAERGWLARASGVGVHNRIAAIYTDRARLLCAFAIHFAAWVIGVGEAAIALYMLGAPLAFSSVLALESLSYALRSAAFVVPAAAGIQEGGYVLLGSLFGLAPDVALALSLLKRGRELILGSLGVLLWQAAECSRLIGRARLAVARTPDGIGTVRKSS
jgi:putative membrane protein